MLPPLFSAAQSLTDDEVLDVFIYATLSSWQREMERQGFDPYVNSIIDTINFAERRVKPPLHPWSLEKRPDGQAG